MTGWCPTCSQEAEGRNRVALDGGFRCNKCENHSRYLADRERRLAAQKANDALRRDELREYQRRYRAERGEEINERRRQARADDPKRFREQELAYRRRLDDQAIERRNETSRRWRVDNPDQARAQSQVGRARRSAILAGTDVRQVTGRDVARIKSVPCLACGATGDGITLDHFIPLVRGGRHSIGNLISLCRSCNSSKRELTWAEWQVSGRPRARALFGDPLREARLRRRLRARWWVGARDVPLADLTGWEWVA